MNKVSDKKQKKIELVTKLTPTLRTASSVVLVNYTGLSVKLQQELKSKLKEVDSDIVVVKNTLIKRALESANLKNESINENVLSGQTALVVSKGDSISAIQVLGNFAKTNNIPQFKVGFVDGNFYQTEGLIKISTLPNKEVLYAQVIGSLMSPMSGLVGTLNGNMQKLLYILDQKSHS
jgi:large subunit ribosomal protein L10